jgi:hypothetical protein
VQLVQDADQDVPDGAAALLRWGDAEPNPAATRDGLPLP